ncbi:MAG: single-stranded DNA-binding protein [Vulcanimicrobiaceae bacterium]
MAGSYNKVILVGNLVRDPEIRYVGSGAAVTKFTLAVNRRSKQQEETDFIDIVAWEKLAETCNTYLKKGMSCLVEGRLSIRSYEDKEGVKRKATEIVASGMQMLDRAPRRENDDGGGGDHFASAPVGAARGNEPDLDEEIPF